MLQKQSTSPFGTTLTRRLLLVTLCLGWVVVLAYLAIVTVNVVIAFQAGSHTGGSIGTLAIRVFALPDINPGAASLPWLEGAAAFLAVGLAAVLIPSTVKFSRTKQHPTSSAATASGDLPHTLSTAAIGISSEITATVHPDDSTQARAFAMPGIFDAKPPVAPAEEESLATSARPIRVFISHSSGDNDFGYSLVNLLRAQGIDAWYDSQGEFDHQGEWQGGIAHGTYWQTEIVRELTNRPVFVVILTANSIASKWVQDEIGLAWSEKNSTDVTKGKIIVPVLRETCTVPPLISLVQYVDFRATVNQEDALRALLAAVRSQGTRPARSVELGPPFDLGLLPSLERFIGREEVLQAVFQLLTRGGQPASEGAIASVAAANGLGGIGKTALATEVVRRLMATTYFLDGIAVVSCKGETDPVRILRLVLARFATGRREPEDDTIPALADWARQMLLGKHALVVLDNVEQGWPVRDVVGPLRAAGVSLLLTSRAELPTVPREASVRLDALPLNEALDVFAEYYGRGTALDLTRPEIEAATRIVEALGRHTLAVKLVAANAATLNRPLTTLAQELTQSPQRGLLLENGEEAVRYVLESSFEALPAEARQLFTAMAAFATGDIGRLAALAMATQLDQENGERSLRQLVELRLADTAFLETMPEASDRERIRLHSLVQSYARDRLSTADPSEDFTAEHAVAAWYEYYTNRAPDLALTPDETNIYGALEWAHANDEPDLVIGICGGLATYWVTTGRVRAGGMYLPWGIEAATSLAAQIGDEKYKQAVIALSGSYGRILQDTGRLDEAVKMYEQQLELVRKEGDRVSEAAFLNNLGLIAFSRGQIGEAEAFYQQALPIMREVESRSMEATLLNNLGQIAFARGQIGEAEAFYQQALPILHEMENRSMEATVLNNMGQVAFARGQMGEAQAYYEQALPIVRDEENRPMEGTVLANLGQVALQRGQIGEAEHYFYESLPILHEVENRSAEATVFNNLGQAAFARGQIGEAEAFYQQALPIMREVQNRSMEATVLNNLGQIAFVRGQLHEAQDYYQQALPILREVENRSAEATVLANLGQVAFIQGQVDQAEQYLHASLPILREAENRSMEATVIATMGQVALQRGQIGEAEKYFYESLPILREVENRSMEATVLNNLGQVAFARGQLAEAADFYKQALPILREVENRLMEATVLANLGQVVFARGQLSEAEDFYKQALPILREVENRSAEAAVLTTLGQVAFARGQLDKAQTLYEQALPILREVENRSLEATVLNNLGQVAFTRGQMGDAQAYYEQALPIMREVENRSTEATVLNNLGQLALQRGQLIEAEDFYKQALPILREVENRSMEATVLNNLGQVAFARGQLAEAQGYYEQALPILREVESRSAEATVLNNLGQVALQRGNLDEAQALYEQSLPILREVENRSMEATVLNNLGQVAFAREQLNEADDFYKQALPILHEVENRSAEATVLANLGQVASARGQMQEARALYEQALPMLHEVENRSGEATLLVSLGQIAQNDDQLNEAEAYYRQSLPILREMQDRSGEGVVLTNLGRLAHARGDLDGADAAFRAALEIDVELRDSQGEMVDLTELAELAEERGNSTEAEEYRFRVHTLEQASDHDQ